MNFVIFEKQLSDYIRKYLQRTNYESVGILQAVFAELNNSTDPIWQSVIAKSEERSKPIGQMSYALFGMS